MQISVQKLDRELPTPARSHPGDAGLDLYARSRVQLNPGERTMVPTGLAVAIPDGYAGLVVPRSGLAARYGVGVLNAPGLIDAGFRGEVHVILVNHGTAPVEFERGDRIAQLVVVAVAEIDLVEVDELPQTARGSQGFGSSGLAG